MKHKGILPEDKLWMLNDCWSKYDSWYFCLDGYRLGWWQRPVLALSAQSELECYDIDISDVPNYRGWRVVKHIITQNSSLVHNWTNNAWLSDSDSVGVNPLVVHISCYFRAAKFDGDWETSPSIVYQECTECLYIQKSLFLVRHSTHVELEGYSGIALVNGVLDEEAKVLFMKIGCIKPLTREELSRRPLVRSRPLRWHSLFSQREDWGFSNWSWGWSFCKHER